MKTTTTIFDVVNSDIAYFNRLHGDKYVSSYQLELIPGGISSKLYSLILNGGELWFGTLEEINAVVKSMIIREKHNDFVDN